MSQIGVIEDNQEIPVGYKKTPVGIIPEKWEVEFLEKVSKRGSGHTPNKQYPEYYNGSIKWVSLADSNKLDRGEIFITEIEISLEGIKNSSAVLHEKGTVLLSRDAGVGKSAIMGVPMAVSQHFITWNCGDLLSNIYLYYYLQFKKGYFERMAVGSTIKTIGLSLFKKFKIPLPPLPEQEKIAEILCTWDRAIENVEAIIYKLKLRNKGLAQQLLKGKKRLKGYKGEWSERHLEEYFQERKETNHHELPLLSVGELGVYPQIDSNKKDNSNEDKAKYKRICIGDIGYNTMRMWQGRSALSSLEGIVSPAYTIVTPKVNADAQFFAYMFKLEEVVHKFFR